MRNKFFIWFTVTIVLLAAFATLKATRLEYTSPLSNFKVDVEDHHWNSDHTRYVVEVTVTSKNEREKTKVYPSDFRLVLEDNTIIEFPDMASGNSYSTSAIILQPEKSETFAMIFEVLDGPDPTLLEYRGKVRIVLDGFALWDFDLPFFTWTSMLVTVVIVVKFKHDQKRYRAYLKSKERGDIYDCRECGTEVDLRDYEEDAFIKTMKVKKRCDRCQFEADEMKRHPPPSE